MKKLSLLILALVLSFTALFLFACGKETASTTASTLPNGEEIPAEGLWKNATYRKNATLGEGNTTFTLTVAIDGKSINLTIKTNEVTVGAALQSLNLIQGEDGAYGLYIKTVNGVLADYSVDRTYWAFYINGEYATTGIDSTNVVSGATYMLSREE